MHFRNDDARAHAQDAGTKGLNFVWEIAASLISGVIIVDFPEFRLGIGQMLVEGGRIKENLRRAERMVSKASQEKCQVIVLPECLDVGWTHPSAHEFAKEIPGEISDRLCKVAGRNSIMIVAGLTECEDSGLYNSALLIDQSGEILLKHRKINVLNIAQELYDIGKTLSVVETRIGTIGVNICADNFRSSHAIGHVLARMGAHFIFSPSAWAVGPDQNRPYGKEWREWTRSYSELSRLYGIAIVGVSNVGRIEAGPWKGKKVIGGSLAMGQDGEALAKGPYGHNAEALITLKLQARPRKVKGTNYAAYLEEKGYEGP